MKDLLSIRIKMGDEQAFELLFKKYYTSLCSYSNKYLINPEEAQDVVQDVFLNLWENRDEIDPEQSLKSYLFRITANSSINKLRRRKVKTKYDEILKLIYVDHTDSSPHTLFIERELSEHIGLALNKIPQQCHKVFNLSRINGLKYSEIAERLNISIKTVEGHMSKALTILRTELKEYLM
jgi:RNA polymerase sigma-70 factor (ECF subfamily)